MVPLAASAACPSLVPTAGVWQPWGQGMEEQVQELDCGGRLLL